MLSDSSVSMPFPVFKGMSFRLSMSRAEKARVAGVIASYARTEMDLKALLAEKDTTISVMTRLRDSDAKNCAEAIDLLGDDNDVLKKRPTRLKLVLYAVAAAVGGYGVGKSGILQTIRFR